MKLEPNLMRDWDGQEIPGKASLRATLSSDLEDRWAKGSFPVRSLPFAHLSSKSELRVALREAFPGISCPSQSLMRLGSSFTCSQWALPLLHFIQFITLYLFHCLSSFATTSPTYSRSCVSLDYPCMLDYPSTQC